MSDILRRHYDARQLHRRRPRPLGDRVRIQGFGQTFAHGYEPRSSGEYFIITCITKHQAVPVSFLRSTDTHEDMQGGFYANELGKVQGDGYRIDLMLR